MALLALASGSAALAQANINVDLGNGVSVSGRTGRSSGVTIRERGGRAGGGVKLSPSAARGGQAPQAAADPGPHHAPGAETLDNAAVVALMKAGLGEPAVIAKIHASNSKFDVATDTLIALRHEGVTSAVIAAMIDAQSSAAAHEIIADSPDPLTPHPAGVYLLADWLPAPKMLAVRPVMTSRTTSGSILGYAFSGGLASVHYRAILSQPHAGIVAGGKRPIFYFYTGEAGNAQALSSSWGAPPPPEEVSLIRFVLTKAGREVRIGSFNIHGASTGVDPQDRISITENVVAPGVIAVQPEQDLVPGEYGFIETAAGTGVGGAQVSTSTARVFDFAVDSAAVASTTGETGNVVDYGSTGGGGPAISGRIGGGRAPSTRRATQKLPKPQKPRPELIL